MGFKSEFFDLISSFKLNSKLKYLCLVELFYLLIAGISFYAWLNLGLARTKAVSVINSLVTQLGKGDASNISLLTSNLISFFLILLIVSILFGSIVLVSYLMARIFIWSKFVRFKITNKLFFRYLLIRIIWFLLWLPLFIVTSFVIVVIMGLIWKPINLNLVYFFFMYFGLFLDLLFFKKNTIFHSITDSFYLGAKSFTKLVIPIIYSFVLFVLLNFIILLFFKINITFGSMVAFIMYIYYISGIRIYVYNIALNQEKKICKK